ncbi:MAG TPA: LCP family protein, partial [Vicinamibacterales bacterium]|nr:LCP family protein [Vicinamibacterales bacterium]
TLLAILVLNIAFFFYHVAAMLDAYAVAQRERSRGFGYVGGAPILLAALISVTLILHGVPEVLGYQLTNSFCQIVRCDNNGGNGSIPPASFVIPTLGPQTPTPIASATLPPAATPSNSGTPGTPGPSGSPGAATPLPTRTPLPPLNPPLAQWPAWAQDNKLNVLIAGTDSRSETGVDDASLRTDTMLLLTVDIEAGKAAMFSFPRNMCTPSVPGSCGPETSESRYPDWLRLPLAPEAAHAYPNGVFPEMLNALWRRAAERPDFPGSEGIGPECAQQFDCQRGWRALTGTLQEMAGVQIDGIIAVNLKGFVSLVENLPPTCPPRDVRVALTNAECYGGIWLDVPEPVHEDVYRTSTGEQIELDIAEGCQFFDGEMALGYARTRTETSDYDRARRQQYVLQQVRKQLDPIALLPQIPALLQVASENLYMTWSDDDIRWLAEAANRIDADRMYRYDFAPNKVTNQGSMDGMRQKVNNIFSEPEPQPETRPNQPSCPPRR